MQSEALDTVLSRKMPRSKHSGPCAIANCTKHTPFYRSFTENAYKTAQREDTLLHFAYLRIGDHLCCSHYNDIVASNRNKQRKSSNTRCVKQVGANSECRVAVNVNRESEKGMKQWENRVFGGMVFKTRLVYTEPCIIKSCCIVCRLFFWRTS